MKKIICILMAISFLSLSACNTIEGLGNDIKSAGEAMSDTAQKAKD